MPIEPSASALPGSASRSSQREVPQVRIPGRASPLILTVPWPGSAWLVLPGRLWMALAGQEPSVTGQERRAGLRLTALRGREPALMKREVPTGHQIGPKPLRRAAPWRLVRNPWQPLATLPNGRTPQTRRRLQGSFRQPPSWSADSVKFVYPLDAPMMVRQRATVRVVSRQERRTGSNCPNIMWVLQST